MKKIIAAIFLILVTANQWGQSFPAMRKADRIRIREAILINKKYGNQIWKGMNKIPFTILLETDSCEYLVNCPVPSGDFIDAGYDLRSVFELKSICLPHPHWRCCLLFHTIKF